MPITIKKKAGLKIPRPAAVVKPPKPTPSEKIFDSMYRSVIAKTPNGVIPWFLMASYLYYIHDRSLLSDELYDEMAKDMLDRWDTLEHRHKQLITPDDLRAGTLYRLKNTDYPGTVRGAATYLVRDEWKVSLDDGPWN